MRQDTITIRQRQVWERGLLVHGGSVVRERDDLASEAAAGLGLAGNKIQGSRERLCRLLVPFLLEERLALAIDLLYASMERLVIVLPGGGRGRGAGGGRRSGDVGFGGGDARTGRLGFGGVRCRFILWEGQPEGKACCDGGDCADYQVSRLAAAAVHWHSGSLRRDRS